MIHLSALVVWFLASASLSSEGAQDSNGDQFWSLMKSTVPAQLPDLTKYQVRNQRFRYTTSNEVLVFFRRDLQQHINFPARNLMFLSRTGRNKIGRTHQIQLKFSSEWQEERVDSKVKIKLTFLIQLLKNQSLKRVRNNSSHANIG